MGFVSVLRKFGQTDQKGTYRLPTTDTTQILCSKNCGAMAAGMTFADLGLRAEVCAAAASHDWTIATPIQASTIPRALRGEDVAGMAETDSGKTGA
jgi:hypothetical protein